MFRGVDAAREALRAWEEAWDEQVTITERIVETNDGRVLLLTTERLRGRDQIELEQQFAAVVTVCDGKIARWDSYWDQAAALEAVGLRD